MTVNKLPIYNNDNTIDDYDDNYLRDNIPIANCDGIGESMSVVEQVIPRK